MGGVEIYHEKGLSGHSDADVLLHAISDACLGALSLGDIGNHFPDNDDRYKDIDSKILLKKVYGLVEKHGYKLNNLDATVVLQRPKIANHIDDMRNSIAKIFNADKNQVSVKATTSEFLGFPGREEGIEAFATVLLIKTDD
jgi:2-C-methyl-D-erythritol 2,4-cyclodiphosphate synthase